jgi:PPM family protein phosphatase
MNTPPLNYRLTAATGLHRGDRPYQQDQVEIVSHPRVKSCLMGVVADGMGGKSGGRKASDQVLITATQLFEQFSPENESGAELLKQILHDAHLMIKLTAITSEEEPHSTLAAFVILPDRSADILHAGDSRVYHFRNGQFINHTIDHSYVQRLVNEGKLTEEQAHSHPQSNLLTGCLGTQQDPPFTPSRVEQLKVGDALMACSDGVWHYFKNQDIAEIVASQSARDAAETLVNKVRFRGQGGGDNLSLALIKLEPI